LPRQPNEATHWSLGGDNKKKNSAEEKKRKTKNIDKKGRTRQRLGTT
jgi:hypothetical protein